MMRWGDPGMLHGLWALVPLAGLILFLGRRRERRLRLLFDDEAAALLSPERSPGRQRTKTVLWLLACALAIVALARPQWGVRWREAQRQGLDIVVVLDTSNSMRAADLRPSRLQQAKWGVGDLLQRLAGDRVGLVAFAGSAFLQCPLTADYAAFSLVLDDVRPGIIPRGGTHIAQALETALAGFEKGGEADRAIVLLTDGEDHEGGIDRAIDALVSGQVRVFAVGVGTAAGAVIPSAAGEGGEPLRDGAGNPVTTALREEALAKIAAATGGMYVRSAADDLGLDRIFTRGLAKLKRSEKETKLVTVYEERFPLLLGAAVLLLSLEALVGGKRRKTGDGAR